MVANGWQLFRHPLFFDLLDKLAEAVNRARTKASRGWRKSANTKLLARQGGTLGDTRTHWFRAKFGGWLRLFFRYGTSAKIIVFA